MGCGSAPLRGSVHVHAHPGLCLWVISSVSLWVGGICDMSGYVWLVCCVPVLHCAWVRYSLYVWELRGLCYACVTLPFSYLSEHTCAYVCVSVCASLC